MKRKRAKPIRLISGPYVFGLCLFAVIFITLVFCYVVFGVCGDEVRESFRTSSSFIEFALYSNYGPATCVLFLMLLMVYVYFAIASVQFFSILCIFPDYLELRAPFHRPIQLRYDKIREVCIDYGIVNGVKQFWICFSRVPIPPQFHHNIVRMALSADMFRIQYSKKAFDVLMKNVPNDMQKRLEKCQSTIRLYQLERQ